MISVRRSLILFLILFLTGLFYAWQRFTPAIFRFDIDAYALAPALERLAELYEAKGDRGNATDHATKLEYFTARFCYSCN